jgi:hypothetical protein
MKTCSHDFVTVDMRGLKAALVARARSDRVAVSVIVRDAVACFLVMDLSADELPAAPSSEVATSRSVVKLSIRLTADEAHQFADGARAAGLSRGAYLADLVNGVPAVTDGARCSEHLAALIASNAELTSLTRSIRHLTALLGQGDVRAAQEYRRLLDTLSGDVRRHLALASNALADLQPRRRVGNASAPHAS